MARCGRTSGSTGATSSWIGCSGRPRRVRRGAAPASCVHGDAGIGKSALVDVVADEARAQAAGRSSPPRGVRSEAHLPFAGLHQLLDPVLCDVDDLPAAQRAALLGALGREDAEVRDVMAIAARRPRARARAGGEPPGRWWSSRTRSGSTARRPTSSASSPVASRLDPVLVVATDRRFPTRALPDVRFEPLALGPLDDGAARELLVRRRRRPSTSACATSSSARPPATRWRSSSWRPRGRCCRPARSSSRSCPVTERLVETFAGAGRDAAAGRTCARCWWRRWPTARAWPTSWRRPPSSGTPTSPTTTSTRRSRRAWSRWGPAACGSGTPSCGRPPTSRPARRRAAPPTPRWPTSSTTPTGRPGTGRRRWWSPTRPRPPPSRGWATGPGAAVRRWWRHGRTSGPRP